ncbi:peptidase S33 family protein, partial [Streptosporangium algeriense]
MLRRGISKLAVVLVAVAALCPTMTALCPAMTAEAADTTGGRGITWEPCEEDPAVECGTLTVPVDWSRPYGDTLDLALARRRATD